VWCAENICFDSPNVPENYVHRIGRAGASGQAVSLVCMDEEGFMHDIERFTRQQIPVQILDGFGPAPDEKAEPIAMGRQTLWGGLGSPPSRDVMQAAARAARQEMMQRIRDSREQKGPRNPQPRPARPPMQMPRDGEMGEAGAPPLEGSAPPPQGERLQGGLRTPRNNRRRRAARNAGGNGNGPNMQGPRPGGPGQPPPPRATREFGMDDEDDRDLDHLPRHIDPLQTNLHGRRNTPRGPSHGAAGQPDPMRTSIDLMGKGGGGGAGRNKRKGGGGSGGNRNYGGYGR
jgi:ATP-dependent RNA helicase RhlE